jgi:hypothetical protein
MWPRPEASQSIRLRVCVWCMDGWGHWAGGAAAQGVAADGGGTVESEGQEVFASVAPRRAPIQRARGALRWTGIALS